MSQKPDPLHEQEPFSDMTKDDFRTLILLPQRFAICRLAPDAALPAWANKGALTSITRTDDELSIVCEEDLVTTKGIDPESRMAMQGVFRCLKLLGPVPFDVTGVIAGIPKPLADANIGVFPIATYNTDLIFISADDFENALDVLKSAGFKIGYPAKVGKKPN